MRHKLFLFFSLFSMHLAFASEDVTKVSEAMGHLIGKNLESLGLHLDIEALIKGMQDEALGKTAPLNEDECIEAIASLQAQKNLEESEAFLKKNKERKEIVSLEDGKLQYEIVKEGKGEPVQAYNSPLVSYKGHFLDGELLGQAEQILSLDEVFAGFKEGLVGMKEGEIRTLYIHPELGYGQGSGTRPNALLIFEVELKKADASSAAHAASSQESTVPTVDKTDEASIP